MTEHYLRLGSRVYRVYRVADNPSCNCDHWHYMFVKGSRKPQKFHHAHPHKDHKSRYAFHRHTASQKASLRHA